MAPGVMAGWLVELFLFVQDLGEPQGGAVRQKRCLAEKPREAEVANTIEREYRPDQPTTIEWQQASGCSGQATGQYRF
jgi:hypothetical protein